jgi:hypothetical protein
MIANLRSWLFSLPARYRGLAGSPRIVGDGATGTKRIANEIIDARRESGG